MPTNNDVCLENSASFSQIASDTTVMEPEARLEADSQDAGITGTPVREQPMVQPAI